VVVHQPGRAARGDRARDGRAASAHHQGTRPAPQSVRAGLSKARCSLPRSFYRCLWGEAVARGAWSDATASVYTRSKPLAAYRVACAARVGFRPVGAGRSYGWRRLQPNTPAARDTRKYARTNSVEPLGVPPPPGSLSKPEVRRARGADNAYVAFRRWRLFYQVEALRVHGVTQSPHTG
jgi:hypothetical protein